MHVRVVCLCHARVCTVVLRALSVCIVVHVVPFRAWGQRVTESLGRGRPRAAPQPKGSTRLHREVTTYTRTPLASLPRTFRGEGRSTTALSLCKPLLSAASWARQDGKTAGSKCLKLHAANLSSWRAPRNSENAAKTAKIGNHVENGKNTKAEDPEDKITGTKDAPSPRGLGNQRESQEKNTNKAARTTGNSDHNERQDEHGETPTRGEKGNQPKSNGKRTAKPPPSETPKRPRRITA